MHATEPNQDASPRESDFDAELDQVAQALELAVDGGDVDGFFETFRKTKLPFVGIDHRHDPAAVFRLSAAVARRLGGISPAVALALENHLYVVAAIALLPTREGEPLGARLNALVDSIRRNRWLVANTNSRVHGETIAKTGTVVRRREEGGFEVSGQAAYMSLATASDLMVFVTFFAGGEPAIFACPSKGNPRIEIGDLLFADTMRESDTRRVTFRELELGEEHLLASSEDRHEILNLIRFELAWHQTLLGALSLGTAARAIEEGRLFLRSVKRPDGLPLSDLDGMVVDMGRQALRYHAAWGAVEQAGGALAGLAEPPFSAAAVLEAFELACAAKYAGTRCAEDAVGVVRRIIGARCFTGRHPLERLSKEVLFAQLGGEVNAFIERRLGERVLSDRPFLGAAPRPQPGTRRKAGARALARAKAVLKAGRSQLDGRRESPPAGSEDDRDEVIDAR